MSADVIIRHAETPRPVQVNGTVRLFQAAAVLTILLLAARPAIGQGVTLGHIAALLLAPIWVPFFRRFPGGMWLVLGGLAATVASIWLTIYSSADHGTSVNNLVSNTLLITGSVMAIGVLFWSRSILPIWLIGVVFGVGMLLAVFTHQDVIGYNEGSGGEINPWKFAFAVPLAVIVLSLAHRTGRRWVEIIALLALALASAKFDSRSYFGEFLVAALLVVWQLLPTGRRSNAPRVLVFFAIVLAAMYNIGTSLILGGVLGEATQARSVQQVDRAGSLIVGSRPEMGATAGLFLSRPFGFGAGTLATSSDIQIAKTGMKQVNYDPENGYVENFLFGSKIEVHSTLGDLWVYAGFAGIAFAAICLVLLLLVVGRGIARKNLSALVLFVVVQSLWNLFFNPLQSSAPVLVVALGLGLAMKTVSYRAERDPVLPFVAEQESRIAERIPVAMARVLGSSAIGNPSIDPIP